MLKVLAIGALIAAFVNPSIGDDPPAVPPPGAVVIDVLTINGSGCVPGSTEVSIWEDNSAFDLLFSAYWAGVGPGFLPTDQRRNCQISVVVHPPRGYTYAIAAAAYQGTASIAQGATATYRTSYYFKGQSPLPPHNRTYVGPYDDQVRFVDVTDPAQTVWAPCGQMRNTNINTEVRVSAGTSDVRNVASSASLQRAGAFALRWRACT